MSEKKSYIKSKSFSIILILVIFVLNFYLYQSKKATEKRNLDLFDKKFQSIEPGDADNKVRKLLGEPNHIVTPTMQNDIYQGIDAKTSATLRGKDIYYEVWKYEVTENVYRILLKPVTPTGTQLIVHAKYFPDGSMAVPNAGSRP